MAWGRCTGMGRDCLWGSGLGHRTLRLALPTGAFTSATFIQKRPFGKPPLQLWWGLLLWQVWGWVSRLYLEEQYKLGMWILAPIFLKGPSENRLWSAFSFVYWSIAPPWLAVISSAHLEWSQLSNPGSCCAAQHKWLHTLGPDQWGCGSTDKRSYAYYIDPARLFPKMFTTASFDLPWWAVLGIFLGEGCEKQVMTSFISAEVLVVMILPILFTLQLQPSYQHCIWGFWPVPDENHLP